MKTLEHLLNTSLPSAEQPSTMTKQPIFSEQQKDSTAYFFVRLKTVYGADFMRHFPDVESEKMAKREWAQQIGQYTRQQIDSMFDHVKSERMRGNEDYQWLDIGNILAILGSSWQHAQQSKSVREALGEEYFALEDKGKKDRARAAGERELSKIKSLFGA